MPLRYRLTKSLFMMPVMMIAIAAHAQKVQLNNHTVPVGKPGALIGQLFNGAAPAKAAKLVEDTSGLFTIAKNGEIRLKKRASLVKEDAAYQYAITVSTAAGKEGFILVKDNFNRNKVVAHRGAWKHHEGSQNSLTSFRDAVKLGCEGSEFDVWLSSDGVPVLSHDPEIGGKKVEETPVAELKKVELKNGEVVPTFEEFIREGMKQNTTKMVLELKPSRVSKERGQQLAQACMDLIRQYKCEGWMLYISFDYDICKKVVAIDPHAKVAYLNGEKSPAELAADKIWGFDYNWKVIDKDMNIFKEARKHKVTVNIWTVNQPGQMDTYLKAGADFLTTDEPEMALEKVK
ncbi:hypothetical protein EGT74_21530 [Chitinophaga lutea]|uniref:GP-PDE domain-containing protein n=2 Tax=Chitinophaga lutea TaxID=2488634 RepID=A0A3N4PS25_9BACT|nr:hypothetical protein EGT74_21530 [Chitinophaga lutea]